jgi:hypothetical protein
MALSRFFRKGGLEGRFRRRGSRCGDDWEREREQENGVFGFNHSEGFFSFYNVDWYAVYTVERNQETKKRGRVI